MKNLNNKNPYKKDPPKRIRNTIYKSVQLARSIRHNVKKELKPIFDIESHHKKWKWPIEKKAKEIGISTKNYEAGLKTLEYHDTIWAGITLFRQEHHFLHIWWKNLDDAEQWAREKKDSKTLLQVEKERQMGIQRLFQTARLRYPDVFDKKPDKPPSKITFGRIKEPVEDAELS